MTYCIRLLEESFREAPWNTTGELPWLRARAEDEPRGSGYGFTVERAKIWQLPSRAQADAKARILSRHLSHSMIFRVEETPTLHQAQQPA